MSELDHSPCREEVLRAEIERLRKEIELLEASRHEIIEIDEQRAAEIERLRADRAGDQQRLFHYEAVIERLRASRSGFCLCEYLNAEAGLT